MLSHSKRSVFYFKKRMILFTLPHHSTPHTPDNAWLPVPESVANTLEGYAHLEQSLTVRQINTCDDFPKPPPQPRNVPPRIAPKKKEKHNDQKTGETPLPYSCED